MQKQLALEKQNKKGSGNDREVAKLSVENEFLKKQIEELEDKLKTGTGFTQNEKPSGKSSTGKGNIRRSDTPNDEEESEVALLKTKLKALREENLQFTSQLKDIAKVN